MIIPYIIITILYTGLNYYLGNKIFKALRYILPKLSPIIFSIIFVIISLPTLLTFLIRSGANSGFKYFINIIGNCYMGLLFYMFLFFILADLIFLIFKLLKIISSPVNSKILFSVTGLMLASAIVIFIYGVYNANQIKTKEYTVEINKSSSVSDINIALISDLHLGYVYDEKHLSKIVNSVNSLEPDIICISGDIFDSNFSAISDPSAIADQLNSFKSKYGTFACLGNHDAGNTYNEMIDFLKNTNVTVLLDGYTVIDNAFIIGGRRDSTPIGDHGNDRTDLSLPDNIKGILPAIVMDHQPSNISEYNDDVDLVLSGHTHKGQIFPLNFITKAYHIADYGYYKNEEGTQMIVTSGAGTWGPKLRIATDSEIALITVKFTKNS